MVAADHWEADSPVTCRVLIAELLSLRTVLLAEVRQELRGWQAVSDVPSPPDPEIQPSFPVGIKGDLVTLDETNRDELAPKAIEVSKTLECRQNFQQNPLFCGPGSVDLPSRRRVGISRRPFTSPVEKRAEWSLAEKTMPGRLNGDDLEVVSIASDIIVDVKNPTLREHSTSPCDTSQSETEFTRKEYGGPRNSKPKNPISSRRTIKVSTSLVRSAKSAQNFLEGEESQEEIQPSTKRRVFKFLTDMSDMFIAAVILMNGIFMGVQTNHMATTLSEAPPKWFLILELMFFTFFLAELLLRVACLRCRFFTCPTWHWNIFDTILVLLQLIEIVMEWSIGNNVKELSSADSLKNLAFVRLLRVMRLLRTLRLVRLLQVMGELNAVVQAIFATLRPLFNTLLLLALLTYCSSIFITQLVSMYIIGAKEFTSVDERLPQYWGSLPRSMLSLFESCFGGVDWADAGTPLGDIHYGVMLLFIAFIAFVTIAMINIITGIFVQSAVSKADAAVVASLLRLLNTHVTEDPAVPGTGITRQRFDEMFDDNFKKQLFEFGINHGEAQTLYDILSAESGRVQVDELVAGMLRLRTNAKFIDTLTLSNSVATLQQRIKESREECQQTLSSIKKDLRKNSNTP
eukprot:TRINITY_DN8224_c0_g1_i5.p1 TRINITY_DN8224_c0_g1~~TRINITY_DN8224_c0_g1_i5.p1  ORF type:complete len:630 (-),score=94.33 TRINITY_DN8224_c0_g1_i5:49-1938(-)